MLIGLVRVDSLDEAVFLCLDARKVFIGVWKNVGFKFELLFNAAELYSSFVCALKEELLSVREGLDQVLQIFFLKAESECGILNRAFVALRGTESKHDLIVAEIIGRVESEKFILIFLDETERYTSLKDQIKL